MSTNLLARNNILVYVLLRHIDRRADFGAAEVPDCCLYLLYIRLSLIVGYEYMKTNALLMPFKLKIEQEYPTCHESKS